MKQIPREKGVASLKVAAPIPIGETCEVSIGHGALSETSATPLVRVPVQMSLAGHVGHTSATSTDHGWWKTWNGTPFIACWSLKQHSFRTFGILVCSCPCPKHHQQRLLSCKNANVSKCGADCSVSEWFRGCLNIFQASKAHWNSSCAYCKYFSVFDQQRKVCLCWILSAKAAVPRCCKFSDASLEACNQPVCLSWARTLKNYPN